jgi:hypothetical protein
MKKIRVYFLVGLLVSAMYLHSSAQSGGDFAIIQSVIAGGGSKSDATSYSITGTVGQSLAGTRSSATPFSVRGGFWQSFLSPTAALVSISGRVLTPTGQPIALVRVTILGSDGNVRAAITNPFGNFRIDDVQAGQTYILSAYHRRYQFVPEAISITDEISDLEIRSIE